MDSVLVVTHSYPLNLAPFYAKFIQDQVLLFNNSTNFNVEVLNLTPKAIPFSSRSKKIKSGHHTYGENVNLETYVSFPGKRFPAIIQKNSSRAISSYLKQKNVRLIHLHWLFPAGLTIKQLKSDGYDVVLTIHGSDWYQSIVKEDVKTLIEEGLNQVDKILFSGPQLMNDVLKVYPDLDVKSQLVYNFIDSSIYRLPNANDSKEATSLLAFDTNKINVLSVANLREEKGIDLLVEAVSRLEVDNIHFHIVGLIEKTDYSRSVFELIEKFDLGSKFTFHGPKPPKEIVNYYFASDMYVLPSRREGFNVSILEASATGLPTLCTDVGGNSDVIDDNSGRIVPIENTDKLYIGLKDMLDSLSSFKPEIISSKTIAKFSEKAMLDRLSKIYSEFV